MKCIKCTIVGLLLCMLCCFSAAGAEKGYSDFWKQDDSGTWHIYDQKNEMIRNAWVCDDAANGCWYLLDTSGNIIASPLVRDSKGNYYSFETDHNGNYGKLHTRSGVYDEIEICFDNSNLSTYGAIINREAIDALNEIYGLHDFDSRQTKTIYTSSFSKTISPCPATLNNEYWNEVVAQTEEMQRYYVQALSLINAERQRLGRQPLVLDDTLCKIGTYRDVEMFKEGYFAHEAPNGDSRFETLMKCFNCHYSVRGENIQFLSKANRNASMEDYVASMDQLYKESPEHYYNIIYPDFRRVGIGITKEQVGDRWYVYYTQIFGN